MEEITLTPYEEKMFPLIDANVVPDKVYDIKPDRKDLQEFLACLEKFSKAWFNSIVLDKENMKFKRVLPENKVKQWIENNGL